jgi:hypothetical protein
MHHYQYPFLIAINSKYFLRTFEIPVSLNQNQHFLLDLITNDQKEDKMHCAFSIEGPTSPTVKVSVYQ